MPPINSLLDARSLTNWEQDCVTEARYMKLLGVDNNRDFKNALLTNGNQLLERLNQQRINNIKQLNL